MGLYKMPNGLIRKYEDGKAPECAVSLARPVKVEKKAVVEVKPEVEEKAVTKIKNKAVSSTKNKKGSKK